jgi:hypothetical protein
VRQNQYTMPHSRAPSPPTHPPTPPCLPACRLLRANVAEAERIINPPLLAVASFSEATTQVGPLKEGTSM